MINFGILNGMIIKDKMKVTILYIHDVFHEEDDIGHHGRTLSGGKQAAHNITVFVTWNKTD